MKEYTDLIRLILNEGSLKSNRTGIDTIAIPGHMIKHNLSCGFPLLTTKFIPFRLVASELEFFIKGITDKKWLQDRNNHIWDEWCSPYKVKYGHDIESKTKMKEERDLGPIYGFQWRSFNAGYKFGSPPEGGVDQLKNIIKTLKTDPNDRRMIVSAWNPLQQDQMAIPPCHYGFQFVVIGNKLNLLWNQRSVDVALGLPFNIASYGLLLHLIAKETGFQEGTLVGFLGDVHIYVDHIEGLKKQLEREPYRLPEICTSEFKSIFDWEYIDTKVMDYKYHPKIKFSIAV